MKKHKKTGFTLVELSIVLVIIGLLIGGILVAQSLIDSTKIQSFTRQIGQWDAAVNSFLDKYGELPGDNTFFNAGDSDGIIEDGSDAIAASTGEIATFWTELSQTGLKNAGGADYVDMSGGVTGGTNAPNAELGTNSEVVAFGVGGSNFYHIGNFTDTDTTLDAIADSIAPADALSVDIKMDDGAPNLGNVVAGDQAVLDGTGVAVTGTTCATATATTATYDIDETDETCQLRIRIGTSHGNLL